MKDHKIDALIEILKSSKDSFLNLDQKIVNFAIKNQDFKTAFFYAHSRTLQVRDGGVNINRITVKINLIICNFNARLLFNLS